MRSGLRQGSEGGRHEKLWEKHFGVDMLGLDRLRVNVGCGGGGESV